MTREERIFHTWGGLWDLLAYRLVSLMGITGGSRVLDIEVGGGSTFLAALQRVGPTGQVVGIDGEMTWIDHVREQIESLELTNARALQMWPDDLQFPDQSFDYVIASFKIWNQHHSGKSLRSSDLNITEIHRVLVSGGQFGSGLWLSQEDHEWMEEFLTSYGQSSRRVYAAEDVETWERRVDETNFHNPLLLQETIQYTYPSKENWWQEMLACGWEEPLDNLSQNQGLEPSEIKETAFSRLKTRSSEDGPTFSQWVLYILANKE